MYLNLYQKYILELLEEYGGLLKRQLEFMVKRFKEPYLRDINGYVYQLRRFEKVWCADYMGEEAVILPGREIDGNIIAAFDIMLEFAEYLVHYEIGKSPVVMRFFINPDSKNEQEINVISALQGQEQEISYYAERYEVDTTENADKISNAPAWIFLIQDIQQMKLISPKAEYSFVIMENGKPVFYEGK